MAAVTTTTAAADTTTKTVLITGGNRGLGKALVECFAAKPDWNVLATARNIESLLPADNNNNGTTTSNINDRYALDLSKHDQVVSLAKILIKENHTIDLIIHNAGFNPKDQKSIDGYFESTFYCNEQFSATNVAESMMINALHPMELTGKLLPILHKDAVVIAISSWLGSIGAKVRFLTFG